MFSSNQDGLNLTDSPLKIQDSQATGQSYNYDYAITGAVTKVLASSVINSPADAQLKSLGLGVHHTATTDVRTVIRAAGTKIQTFDPATGTIVDQSEDTSSPNSNFLAADSTQPVVMVPFNSLIGGTILWLAGGGMSHLYGYTGSNVTQNGTPVPTGSITATVLPTSGGTFATTGIYFYAVAFRKTGTQALSNAVLDLSATITSTSDRVSINWSTLTNIDTSKYDKVYIYRSAVGGVSGFTTGDLIAQVAIGTTSFIDNGSFITTASNIPRSGSSVLDNSVLPSGNINSVTSYRGRLIVAINGTFYISDLNKPESWPAANVFTPDSGGPILALGTIGVPSEYTTGADQYACIWKENELWVFTGSSLTDWELLFVDKTGCIVQSLVVSFNGFVGWITLNGIYLWDGKGKPSRISRPIQALFSVDGDLDLTKLSQGYGAHYKSNNQVIWRVSHKIKGTNKIFIKMDTRLSAIKMSQASPNLQNPELDGVFILDFDANAYYTIATYRPSGGGNEQLLVGDDTGFVYNAFVEGTTAASFTYETRPIDLGAPENNKRFKRVIVFLEKLTPNDLTLYFWADNRIRDEYRSKLTVSMSPLKGTQPALWDIALWDLAMWDDYTPDISAIQFNLHSAENNAEGTAIKLRFEQIEASAPVRIHGFGIEWEDMGPISIPTGQVF